MNSYIDLSPIRSGIGQLSSCSNAPLHDPYTPLFASILVYFFYPGNGAYVSELIQKSFESRDNDFLFTLYKPSYTFCYLWIIFRHDWIMTWKKQIHRRHLCTKFVISFHPSYQIDDKCTRPIILIVPEEMGTV